MSISREYLLNLQDRVSVKDNHHIYYENVTIRLSIHAITQSCIYSIRYNRLSLKLESGAPDYNR